MSLYKVSARNKSTTSVVEDARQHVMLQGIHLLLARGASSLLAALLVAFFVANLPVYFTQLQTVCDQVVCSQWQLTAANASVLQHAGISISLYASLTLALNLFSALVWFAVGTFIAWRKSNDLSALLTSLLLVMQGILEPCGFLSNGDFSMPLAYSSPVWYVPTVSLLFLDVLLMMAVFSLFPNGRFAPGWMRWLVPVEGALMLIVLFWYMASSQRKTPLILFLIVGLWFLIVASILGGQIYRYRRVSSPVERQQTRWIVFGSIGEFGLGVVYIFPFLLFPELSTPGSPYFLFVKPLAFILALFGPLCFGVAILRYRLWNIDIILHRTLVYAALTACVIGLYILIVVGLGSLVHALGNVILSLLATGLIAVLFQPLRQRLQQAVNRLLYGERDDPYGVLARLSTRLEATLVPETVLPTIVETVAQTLKLPYVAIVLLPEEMAGGRAEAEAPGLVTSYGMPAPDPMRVPLVYQAETIGYLLLATGAGEAFGKKDAHLLADLARQAGVAVYAVRLTTSLQRLSTSLQQTREDLVTTREEERRRLRRDLHDGLGPTLASLTLKVDAARNLLTRDSERADMLLAAVRHQTEEAITEIRRLVYNLRPPALDELGLLSALREQVMLYQHEQLEVVFDTPPTLPTLSAAVEVAAYRIAQEALTNVARHAQARHCHLHLAIDAETVHLDIADDGKGIPAEHHIGIGLHTMHERASELGGSCTITPDVSGGTIVRVRLPLGVARGAQLLHKIEQDVSKVHQEEIRES